MGRLIFDAAFPPQVAVSVFPSVHAMSPVLLSTTGQAVFSTSTPTYVAQTAPTMTAGAIAARWSSEIDSRAPPIDARNLVVLGDHEFRFKVWSRDAVEKWVNATCFGDVYVSWDGHNWTFMFSKIMDRDHFVEWFERQDLGFIPLKMTPRMGLEASAWVTENCSGRVRWRSDGVDNWIAIEETTDRVMFLLRWTGPAHEVTQEVA